MLEGSSPLFSLQIFIRFQRTDFNGQCSDSGLSSPSLSRPKPHLACRSDLVFTAAGVPQSGPGFSAVVKRHWGWESLFWPLVASSGLLPSSL